MGRDRLQVRLPDDMSARIEEFREERGLNESEAGRRLLLRGLDAVDQMETADTPAGVDDETAADGETTSFRQGASRLERLLGSGATLLVVGFVASEAFGAPVLSEVSFAGAAGVVTYAVTTAVVRRFQAARAARASDTDESAAAEPATGGD